MRRLSGRMKRTTKQYITVCIIAVIVTSGAAVGISARIIHDIKTSSDAQIQEYKKEIEENKKTVYIAENFIMAGEIISEDSLKLETVFASQPEDVYIDKDDIGKIAIVDIKSGTHVLKSMVTDIKMSNVREVEFDTILVSSNIVENDIVDVRIVFPNGEDYTVLSKTRIKGYEYGSANCFLWLTEEEIIRMQSAIVDAYLYTGAYLYTVKYIEPNIQDATVVNYEPSVAAIRLIQKNPNIIDTAVTEMSVAVRKALENRLVNSFDRDVKKNKWPDIEDEYIYHDYKGEIEESEEIIDQEDHEDAGENISEKIIYNDIDVEAGDVEIINEESDEPPAPSYFPELGYSYGFDDANEIVCFTEGKK